VRGLALWDILTFISGQVINFFWSHNVHFAAYFDIILKNIFRSEAECLTMGQIFCIYKLRYFLISKFL
jgi:hypothetical protein